MIGIKHIKKTTYSYMELEQWLEENKGTEVSIDEIFDLFLKKFSIEDVAYLIDAYRIPRKEIEYYLNIYYRSKPKYDELDFIYNLSKLYKTDEQTIIRRIREIKILKKEEKTLDNGNKNKKRKK